MDEAAAPVEVVTVRLGASRYAVPMGVVAEVGRPPALTRVPGLPGWVAGVANWRGRVLAVIDLRPLLGEAATPLDRRGRLAVLRRGSVAVGLLVDAVEGTRLVEPDLVEPTLAHLPGRAAGLLAGQVTDPDGPCGVLDVDAVFRLPDALPRARRTA